LHVVAGALVDAHGRVLVAQRPAGKELAGRWEFPGGKLGEGETPRAALARELREELGIELESARPLIAVRHPRPGGSDLLIDCWRVDSWRGEPTALDGQRLRWCEREQLPEVDILEADRAIVTALRLPPAFVHVAEPELLAERLPGRPGRERVAWLVPSLPADAGIVRRLREHGDSIFVLDPHAPPLPGVGSVYSTAHRFERAPHAQLLAGRLVHSAAAALAAAADGADFLLVPDPVPGPADLAGIAAASLPYYVAVTESDESGATPPGGADTPRPTGRLWWQPGPPRLLL
jgi:8-oxo-dGTP diphosphatase